jgi:hypothetical protein
MKEAVMVEFVVKSRLEVLRKTMKSSLFVVPTSVYNATIF